MDLKTLGKNIRRIRQQNGLTQENAANDLDCSLNTYTKIERGETNVPFLRLVQIAEYFNVPLTDLVRDEREADINNLSTDIKSIKDDIEIIKNSLSHR